MAMFGSRPGGIKAFTKDIGKTLVNQDYLKLKLLSSADKHLHLSEQNWYIPSTSLKYSNAWT